MYIVSFLRGGGWVFSFKLLLGDFVVIDIYFLLFCLKFMVNNVFEIGIVEILYFD